MFLDHALIVSLAENPGFLLRSLNLPGHPAGSQRLSPVVYTLSHLKPKSRPEGI